MCQFALNQSYKVLFVSWLYFLCTSCNHSSERSHKNDKKTIADENVLEYQTYGLFDIIPEQKEIAKKYGLTYRAVAGCGVTDSLRKAVKAHNNEVLDKLVRKYGQGWPKKFQCSVDSFYSIDSMVIEIAKHHKAIKALEKKIETFDIETQYSKYLSYSVSKTKDPNEFIVFVNGYGLFDKRIQKISFIRALVNRKKQKVISLETTQYAIN